MSETKVSRNEIKEQIESIKNATETIRIALEQMPECGIKKSFCLNYKALALKVEKYSTEPKQRVAMSDEEKELIRKFREGKITITENESDIPALPSDDDSNTGNESVTEEPEKKKRRR